MNIAFLSPSVLWLLWLAMLPIIIHLFNFRLYKTVAFNNVHLLKEIKKDRQSKNKLREWLILLLRILFIVALVLAFAQPVILKDSQAVKGSEELIVVIDNSLSMSGESKEGLRFDWAKNKALEIINTYPSSSKIIVCGSDIQAKDLHFTNKDRALKNLSKLNLSPFGRPISSVLHYLEQTKDSLSEQRHIYIISDFQKNNLEANFKYKNKNSQLFLVHIDSKINSNVYLDTCYLAAPYHNTNESEKLIYTIVNNSQNELLDYNVELYLNGKLKTISTLSIPPESKQNDTLIFQNEGQGLVQGELSISDFPVAFDNHLYFSYLVARSVKVDILSATPLDYVEQLLSDNPIFQFSRIKPSQNKPLNGKLGDVLIVNASEKLDHAELELLQKYITAKRNIIILYQNEQAEGPWIAQNWGLNVQTVSPNECHINKVNFKSAPFKDAFSKLDQHMNYPLLKQAYQIGDKGKWLIKNRLGNNLVALIQKNAQKTLFVGIPLSNASFYTHPLFIPLIYAYLNKSDASKIYSESDENTSLTKSIHLKNNDLIKIEKDSLSLVPQQYNQASGLQIHIPARLEAGSYTLKLNDSLIDGLSINWTRAESHPSFYQLEELKTISPKSSQILDSEQLSYEQIKDFSQNHEAIWYYFVLLALGFVLLEMLFLQKKY